MKIGQLLRFLHLPFFIAFSALHGASIPQPVEREYPVIIIGSGVAALTAATYLGRAGISSLVIEGETIGGAITQSDRIQNWPGEIEITGEALAEKLYAQAAENGAEFLKEKVIAVDFSKTPFTITTQSLLGTSTKVFKTVSCILALGSHPNLLHIAGEEKYWSKGVFSCAVCDGSLYKDKVVAVVGGGDAALVDAEYLTTLAKKVYLIVRKDHLKAGELKRVQKIEKNPKITIFYDTIVKEIRGNETTVSSLKLENVKTQKLSQLDVDAVFIKIGSTPNTALFQGQLNLTPQGYIQLKTGQETSVPGVFAAGDVAKPEFQQAVCAAAAGAEAADSVGKYLLERMTSGAVSQAAPMQEGVIEVGSYQELISWMRRGNQKITFIDFYSTSCPPCKAFAPAYVEWAHGFSKDIRFFKVNAATGQELFHLYGIQGIPSLVILDNQGNLLMKKVGLEGMREVDQKLKMCQAGESVQPELFKSVR